MKNILGISGLYHDSAAALVSGGEVVAAAQEERFTRRKHDASFPRNAIDFCLSRLPEGAALDAVVFYEDPLLSFDRVVKSMIEGAPRTADLWGGAMKSQLTSKLGVSGLLRDLLPDGAKDQVFFVDHHMSHAASAFYPSGFDRAAILVVDGVGEWASTTLSVGEGGTIRPLSEVAYPHSLGLFYSAFTYHCGLKVNSGEYKLMGLAPYGRPTFVKTIRDNLIDLRDDGSFRINAEYFGFLDSEFATNERFEALFGCPRLAPEAPLTPLYMDIAASAQAVLEEAMLGLAKRAVAETGSTNLCMAGGVALNCVASGRLLREMPDLNVWVQPAAGDAGGALGAALHVAHAQFGAPRVVTGGAKDGQKGSLLGPAFGREAIEAALVEHGIAFHELPDDDRMHARVAEELAAGKIVGRFDGPMEFGPRALGNRSIIADPRRPDGQSYINKRIKFRESWRPFAPVVLSDRVEEYFDLRHESPYMLLVCHLKEDKRWPFDWGNFWEDDHDMLRVVNLQRSDIPSVTHVDYSARVQTVDPVRNPRFHGLLSKFEDLTGCPVLINTSFNVRGEPIVCTPADAVRCFVNTGIDVLAIGNFIALKSEQSPDIIAREGETQYELD